MNFFTVLFFMVTIAFGGLIRVIKCFGNGVFVLILEKNRGPQLFFLAVEQHERVGDVRQGFLAHGAIIDGVDVLVECEDGNA